MPNDDNAVNAALAPGAPILLVVIVVDEAADPGPFRSVRYAPSESVGVAVDVLVYTPEEAANWSARFKTEVERGVVLYRRETSS